MRVSQRAKGAAPLPGDAIRTRATLMPPPEPASPGAFDFGRYYWFMGLGGSGYVTGKIEPMPNPPPVPFDLRLHAGLAKLRQGIAARIGAVLDGDAGAIAKAMIMGDQGQISEKATKALRDSGLYHVISISGFHMALTAGTMFWLIRAVLALFPSLALRFPLKIWAGIGALAVATAYLAISGSAVAAVRSYIMVAIVFARHHPEPARAEPAQPRHRRAAHPHRDAAEPHRRRLPDVLRGDGGADRLFRVALRRCGG